MFKKILVANRGEIACRVMKTARQMGIATVAVYSDADRQALHRRSADESVWIGPAPAAESYLNAERIIEACIQTGAEAVHPGYGFLSENPRFVKQLEEKGITFIGPNRLAIEIMGDKIASKKSAEAAKVNTIPGCNDIIRDHGDARRIAREVGYPVMFKASAGGGGKGMRVVRNDAECEEAFERASSEARTSFGDDRLFVEKFIEQPRHIEIQVLADAHGNVLSLGERECSIQRRHQKVIEEAPSPFLDAATREQMGAQAVQLARSVDYQSVGTVEFIVDQSRNFYFLEMNTRLQVEHPVTEWVTGIDLVEQMIRVAAGESLTLSQSDIRLTGWAIECRVYAEDPFRGFMPSTGRVTTYLPPVGEDHVRVDTGVWAGSDISVYYDPMIAKLITHGSTRASAIARMSSAIDAFYIEGVSHNGRFLSTLVNHPRFVAGDLTTALIDETYPQGFAPEHTPHREPNALIAVAAFMHGVHYRRDFTVSGSLRRKCRGSVALVAVVEDVHYPIEVVALDAGCDVHIAGQTFAIRSDWRIGDPLFIGSINAEPVFVQARCERGGYRVVHTGASLNVSFYSPRVAELSRFMLEAQAPDLSRFLLSPMPGLLISVSVTEGLSVKAGEELVVVEAMKMENTLRATRDAVVTKILAGPGETVAVNQPLLEFE